MTAPASPAWPEISRQTRPWTYWWWMGSAVDQTNLTRELQRYQAAGLGGVHIIPIYGAKGYEDKFIDYLSPQWMAMLGYTVQEAQRLGLGVDLTTGSGWCFGGPQVTDQHANALAVARTFEVAAGARLAEKVKPDSTQALVAFSPEGQCVELTGKIAADGSVNWTPPSGTWQVYVISPKTLRPESQTRRPRRPGPYAQSPLPPGCRAFSKVV